MKQSSSLYLAPQNEIALEHSVEHFFKLHPGDIFVRTNRHKIALPRKIAQFLRYKDNLSNYNEPKWSKIASKYQGRNKNHMNHASIIHNVQSVIDIMEVDKKFRQMVYDCQLSIWGEIKYKN